jgi:hypothetical protein
MRAKWVPPITDESVGTKSYQYVGRAYLDGEKEARFTTSPRTSIEQAVQALRGAPPELKPGPKDDLLGSVITQLTGGRSVATVTRGRKRWEISREEV